MYGQTCLISPFQRNIEKGSHKQDGSLNINLINMKCSVKGNNIKVT